MKQRSTHSFIGYTISYLMIFLFTAMPLLQAFHTHEVQHNEVSKDGQQLTLNVDCQFCDQYTHQQPSPLTPISLLSILYFGNSTVISLTDNVPGLVLLPGLSSTNKGPPSFFA